MNGHGTVISAAPSIFNPEQSLNKYLLNISDTELIADVESFTGEEALSYPYRYTIRFTSTTDDKAFRIVKKAATFILRAANPQWSKYVPVADKWVTLRKIPGVITAINRISGSVDETLYEAVLEHPLALLDTRYRSAIYQDVSVPELVKKILKEHGFEGCEINFDQLFWTYPPREMIVQWQETDLAFIRRLLSEVGICFRFELHQDHDHIVVMNFGDSQANYIHNHSIAALNPAGTIGDRWATDQGVEVETSWRYARIRHEYLLSGMTILSAIANDPAIVPGMELDISGATPEAFREGMLVTSHNSTRNVIRTARNNKLRMEDSKDQEHIKLATAFGKTQLNRGHMVDSAGRLRGAGH